MAGPAYPLPLPSPHLSLSRPGLSLWQVPPISFLHLPHTFPSPSYRPGLSLWQVPPISFSLSLIGPACHCGRSRLSPLSIFFTFLPLSLSYRPGLSLWQVPPFLSPFLPSSPSSPFHFPLFYRPGLSLWQVPPIFDFTSIIQIFSTSSTPLPYLIGPACHCGRSRLIIPTLLIKTNILLASQIYPNSHRSLLIPTNLQDLQYFGLSQIFTDLH